MHWHRAQEPAGFLEGDKPASQWSPARRGIVERAYGYWLAHLDRNGALDPSCTPGARATEARLRAFVLELQGRLAPVSVGLIVGALHGMLVVLAPDGDWTTLGRLYSQLKRSAAPSRDKLGHMVAAADLFELGIRLMETCEDGPPQRVYEATQYRDGALLICAPIRVKNLTGLVIGRHLVFDGQDYRVELTAAETKAGRPYHAAVPPELTPYVGRYLRVYRPMLQSVSNPRGDGAAGGRLWIGRQGMPLSYNGVRRQITERTKAAFGKHIWPHLFRDCAVTEFVDSAPEEIGSRAPPMEASGA